MMVKLSDPGRLPDWPKNIFSLHWMAVSQKQSYCSGILTYNIDTGKSSFSYFWGKGHSKFAKSRIKAEITKALDELVHRGLFYDFAESGKIIWCKDGDLDRPCYYSGDIYKNRNFLPSQVMDFGSEKLQNPGE